MADNIFENLNFDPENMKTAQDNSVAIQGQMLEAQKRLTALEIEGKAGLENYSVSVFMNGRHEATKVNIDPQLFSQPPQVLKDLVAAAITDAAHKVETSILGLFKNLKFPS